MYCTLYGIITLSIPADSFCVRYYYELLLPRQVAKIHDVLGTPSQTTLDKLRKYKSRSLDFNFPYKRGKISFKSNKSFLYIKSNTSFLYFKSNKSFLFFKSNISFLFFNLNKSFLFYKSNKYFLFFKLNIGTLSVL